MIGASPGTEAGGGGNFAIAWGPRTVREEGGKCKRVRKLLLRTLLVLVVWSMGCSTTIWGGNDAFELLDYKHCPSYLRLPAPTELHASLTEEEGGIAVGWAPVHIPVQLPDKYRAQLTVIAEGAGPRKIQAAPLGVTSLEFADLALARNGTLYMAITNGSYVISDMVTSPFRTGVATPQLSAPFYFRDGDTVTPTQGIFYYIGFSHNFTNGYVDTGRTNPRTPSLRFGFRHGTGYDPADADFAHFRLRLENKHGTNIMDFDAATIPANGPYEGKELVLGVADAEDIADPGMASFATLRHSRNLPSPAPVVWEAAVTMPYYQNSNLAPTISRQAGGTNQQPLAFTNLAPRGRALFVPVPDEMYELPPDILKWDGRYWLTAWAEDATGKRISPNCNLIFNASTHLDEALLYTNVWGYDETIGSNRHDSQANYAGPGRVQEFLLLADDCGRAETLDPTRADDFAPVSVPSRPFSLLSLPQRSLGAGYNLTYWIENDGSLGMLDDITGRNIGPYPEERTPPTGDYKAVGWGRYMGCAIKQSDDTAVCWGIDASWLPLPPPPDLGAVKTFAVGAYHACAVRQTDSAVLCWGDNLYSQTDVPSGEFYAVSAGWFHSCGLQPEGQVTCWGDNFYGQTDVPNGLEPVRAITSGDYHNCAVRANDTVICWGRSDRGQLQVPSNLGPVTTLSAGYAHTCALLQSNAGIVCWGDNAYGQISQVPSGGTWQDLSAGKVHTCGRRQNGTVECWRLRDTSSPPMTSLSSGMDETCGLRQVDSFLQCWGDLIAFGSRPVVDGRGVYPVAFKSFYNASIAHCGIRTDDTLECWGLSSSSIPSELPDDLGTVKAVSAYRNNACVIKTDDSLVCWGDDADGQATVPAGLSSVKAVDIGFYHACAIKADDTLVCWGSDDAGQSSVPGNLGTVKFVGVGSQHTCVIKADDTVECWGYAASLPVPSDLGTVKVLGVAQEGSYSCAIKTDGSADCWGSSGFCPLDPTCQPETLPTGLPAVSAISAGPEHVCALLESDQTVTCWGYESYGETLGPTYP